MRYLIGIMMAFLGLQQVYATDRIIEGNVVYTDTTVDLTKGSIIIKNGGKLTIKNSDIIGTLSEEHSFLIKVQNGSLVLSNNNINVDAPSIAPHDQSQSLQNAILLEHAALVMHDNIIMMHDSFRAGLVISDSQILTNNLVIKNNYIEGFHGALYLLNSDNLLVQDNVLKQNSYGNIVISGKGDRIIGNKIYLAGRDRLGNSIDLLGASNVLIDNNLLFMPTCHGIYSILSNDVVVQNNDIIGGITYAMTFLSKVELTSDTYMVKFINPDLLSEMGNSNNIIVVNNYMAQNRYGIQASDIVDLDIQNNFFSQRFGDAIQRLFWTDNQNLLKNIMGLSWKNNLYKESFTQDNAGSNASTNVVPFPEIGGVHL